MKYRFGYVSNSSSSSFVVPLDALTATQRLLIKKHSIYAKQVFTDCEEEEKPDLIYSHCEWDITEENGKLCGWASMDNFNMREWMQEIGVPMNKVKWED